MTNEQMIHLAWKIEGSQAIASDGQAATLEKNAHLRVKYVARRASPIIRRKDAFDALLPIYDRILIESFSDNSAWRGLHGIDEQDFQRFSRGFENLWHQGMISVNGNELRPHTDLIGTLVDGMKIIRIGKPVSGLVVVNLENGENRLFFKNRRDATDPYRPFDFFRQISQRLKRLVETSDVTLSCHAAASYLCYVDFSRVEKGAAVHYRIEIDLADGYDDLVICGAVPNVTFYRLQKMV